MSIKVFHRINNNVPWKEDTSGTFHTIEDFLDRPFFTCFPGYFLMQNWKVVIEGKEFIFLAGSYGDESQRNLTGYIQNIQRKKKLEAL